jgi:elongation factor P--(R)-beta-lysine ligase
MVLFNDIPEYAICHKCGKPMKVIDLHAKYGMREGAFTIECCEHELTIEDDQEAEEVKEILLAYHRQENDRSGSNKSNLQQRSLLLRRLRDFFYERGFIEVETPLVADEVIPELHIEPTRTADGQFLQASPELHMKRLLAAGAKAIFQITRSFRASERGPMHNPEFTMVEWYRVGDDMRAGIELLDELAQTTLATPPCDRTTYAAVFERVLNVDPHAATIAELSAAAAASKIAIPSGINSSDRDEWLNLLLATVIEPQLGRDRPEIIYHYPASQASLSRVTRDELGREVAERFELYYHGIELANGFHELTDAGEQRRRFEEVNAARITDGRPALPLPETFLAAIERGIPNCTGVALGFDRLLMLAVGAKTIGDVIAFPQR